MDNPGERIRLRTNMLQVSPHKRGRFFHRIDTFILAALLSLVAIPDDGSADELGDAVRTAVEKVAPSVVRIRSVGTPDDAGRVSSRITTGIVVSADGEVVTSSFGFGDGLAATFVETADGKRHAAKIVARDDVRQLVLLKTDAPELIVPEWMPDDPAVGTWSIACGRFYPTDIPSASLGVISAQNRIHGLAIQTDAKVSPVNYGGPLIGMDGRVAGILVPLAPQSEMNGVDWYDSGIGFAVPARDLLKTADVLRAGNDKKRGVLGIALTSKSPLSTDVVVRVVVPGSPAAAAGLQADDRIVSANGIPIDRLGTLQRVLASTWAGESLDLTIRRGENDLQLSPVLVDAIDVPPRGWVGLVPLADVREGDISVAARVGVMKGSPADEAGMPTACRITKIDDSGTRSLSALRTALSGIRQDDSFTITWSPLEDVTAESTISVDADEYPADVSADDLLDMLKSIGTSEAATWKQSVSDLNEDTHLWKYAPEEPDKHTEYGLLFVLADGEPAKEVLLTRWQSLCEEHRLILAVVYRDYSLPLSDAQVLLKGLSELSQSCALDSDRLAIQTGEINNALAARLLLNPRLRLIRQAVFRDCRPVTAGLPTDVIRAKQPAYLILSSAANAQDAALLETTGKTLRRAGATVTIRDADELDEKQRAQEVVRWLLLQKVY